jgi:hypothetical protein
VNGWKEEQQFELIGANRSEFSAKCCIFSAFRHSPQQHTKLLKMKRKGL